MYIISGQFKVKEQYKDELIKLSLELIPPSENETGCISYSFLEDKLKRGHFLFFERWKTRQDITQHFGKTYFKFFAERFPDMIEGEAIIEIHEIKNTEIV